MHYSVTSWAKYLMVAALAIVFSCDSNNETAQAPNATDYLPMRKGLYMIYDVTETDYTLSVATTSTYELKTVVVDSIVTSKGYDYVIYRYKKLPDQPTWTYLDTWSASVNKQQAIINEANIEFLKFKTPLAAGLEWNGNSYNNDGEDIYVMQDLNTTHSYNGLDFGDCFTVTQSDNGDFIVFLDQRQEVFSRNVGLIYKETTQLHYCTQTENDCLGKQYVEDGLIYKQTIRSYGTE